MIKRPICDFCGAEIFRTQFRHGYKIIFKDTEHKFCSLGCMDCYAKQKGIKKYYYVAF